MEISCSESNATPLKQYESPVLVCFGDLSKLTAAGSGTQSENRNSLCLGGNVKQSRACI